MSYQERDTLNEFIQVTRTSSKSPLEGVEFLTQRQALKAMMQERMAAKDMVVAYSFQLEEKQTDQLQTDKLWIDHRLAVT